MTNTVDSTLDKKEAAAKKTGRSARRKTYERVRESAIPQEVVDHFAKDDYELRWVRWLLQGQEDLRNLSKREREGYEFVLVDELPHEFLKQLRVESTKAREGLVTSGDLCLMKIDRDLRNSRRDFFANEAEKQIRTVDVSALKRKGFYDMGSKTQVMSREPTFSD